MRTFKEQVEGILGLSVEQPQEKPHDVIELSPIEEFRKTVQDRLNGIKSQSLSSFGGSSLPVVPQGQCCSTIPQEVPQETGVLIERENPIGVNTLHGAIMGMGPKAVGEAISKLSTEKNVVDDKGIASSEFELFVKGLKQDAVEKLLGKGSVGNASGTPSPSPSGTTPTDNPEQEELPNLTPEQKTEKNIATKL